MDIFMAIKPPLPEGIDGYEAYTPSYPPVNVYSLRTGSHGHLKFSSLIYPAKQHGDVPSLFVNVYQRVFQWNIPTLNGIIGVMNYKHLQTTYEALLGS